MRLIIQENYENVSSWTAAYIVKRIHDFEPTGKGPFVMGLPTGSSPIGTYEELIRLNKEGKVSFKNVVTFNMDEYVNLPEDHPESYHSFMQRYLFGNIDIPQENINILDGNAEDLEAECARYEEKMQKLGGVELFLGGVGEDGHIAFNEPGSSLQSRTRIKTLTHDTIIVNSRFFDGDISRVPKHALTVGVGTVTDAKEVVLIVSGHNKTRALKKIIEEGVSHMWTASILQLHPRSIVICDKDATEELEVSTVNYFMDMERDNLKPVEV